MSDLFFKTDHGKIFKIWKSCALTRDMVRFASSKYIYVSLSQFKIIKTGEEWFIESLPGTVNPAYINGFMLTERTKFKNGDETLIGNIRKCTGLRLNVLISQSYNEEHTFKKN